ncbi:ribosome small subunit-dependent GTPase A [Paracrocinitomix mangrovi]|uniref:ribosome small subunit-dependent GTPase A n=1 Tax=Paracrocinitomix mangrovi TaxID=2862509 RepID=UPI001EDC4515|nr:ribosome small subunit-dependent GTPase A [Paracrocinitomix mangrovi]UKN00924.1 ribosome small subunit-dependent GTPase A [Paracrocinitomix mangrovi]
MKKGIVIKSTGSWYRVMEEDGKERDCRIRGKLRLEGIKSTNPVAVGDEVMFEIEENDNGVIKEILPRKNYIIRKSINLSKRSHILAANIDHVYLLVTLVAPQTHTAFIDRFLVTAEAYHIPVTILFNKVDLYEEEDLVVLENFMQIYKDVGYRCLTISAQNEQSVAFLREEIKGKKVMFGGHSGVGKSTLINTLDSTLDLKTGKISMSHLAGQHTTTFAEMYPLKTGGFIIDTPGIKAFGLIDFDKSELSHYFPEMRAVIHDCKFNNCQHLQEPQCAVKEGVESGEISAERYYNYVTMMEADEDETYRKDIYK